MYGGCTDSFSVFGFLAFLLALLDLILELQAMNTTTRRRRETQHNTLYYDPDETQHNTFDYDPDETQHNTFDYYYPNDEYNQQQQDNNTTTHTEDTIMPSALLCQV
ncbi:hypothetical protein Pmani_034147 [Petrolisthes manimaculis]|uniref:Uncharacterized protein n=1 Tax=Petrolisthes manimaculis TaxID=1843537 RepID=A0AAE1TPQ2_9EUCA|nr:hypothetical protein Pmani_034147 [Petrolisthes manimaculis]